MSSWSSIQKPDDGPQTAVLKDDICVWSNCYASMVVFLSPITGSGGVVNGVMSRKVWLSWQDSYCH